MVELPTGLGKRAARMDALLHATMAEVVKVVPLAGRTMQWYVEHERSAFPASTGGGDRSQTGVYSDPTPRAALTPDKVDLELRRLEAVFEKWRSVSHELATVLRDAQPLTPEQAEAVLTQRRETRTSFCRMCNDQADRLRRGLCDPCYTAWVRYRVAVGERAEAGDDEAVSLQRDPTGMYDRWARERRTFLDARDEPVDPAELDVNAVPWQWSEPT